jgi:uncharacterized protein (DUF362 family)/ferredoxin
MKAAPLAMDDHPAVACVACSQYRLAELRRAVAEAVALVGGWPTAIRPGARVLLKPNLLSARPPEEAVTTHPEFVRAVICELRTAGVTDLTLGDSPAGDHAWETLWGATGMSRVADEEGVRLLPFERTRRIEIAGAGPAPLLAELDDFDAVISLPKLKTHLLTKLTAAVKNSYGLMPGAAKSGFHGQFPSPRKMAFFLAEFFRHARPDFVLMDAVECMVGDGPGNGRPHPLGRIFAGADAVAMDAAVAPAYGYRPDEIPLLVRCAELGLGVADPARIRRTGDGWPGLAEAALARSRSDFLHRIPEMLFLPMTWLLTCRPCIDPAKCVRCGACRAVCSQGAVEVVDGRYRIAPRRCILCMCCLEACPHHAVELRSPGVRLWSAIRRPFRREE